MFVALVFLAAIIAVHLLPGAIPSLPFLPSARRAPSPAPPLVHTKLGSLLGRSDGGVDAFLGVPYAAPPLGDRRFAPAVPPEPWGARNATTYGAPCHQTTGRWDDNPSEHPDPEAPPPSEDCLFLNIFRPRGAENLPVLVWIHGGGLCTGAGSLAWTNGSRLAAEQQALVVTLNYRLGPLGFLALPELRAAYGANGALNGVRDQIAALAWLREHVAHFGGDPSAVTIFGQSSGGVSVCVLNASPKARGLFHRAIVQSGPCIVPAEGWGPQTAAHAEAMGAELRQQLGAVTLAELRALPAQRVQWSNETLNSDNFAGYALDGFVLSAPPRAAYAAGNVTPMILGTTSYDGTAQHYGFSPLLNATANDWAKAMVRRWKATRWEPAAVMAQYKLSRFAGSAAAAYIAADNDQRLFCPTREMARLAIAAGVPVYHYQYAHLSLTCDSGYDYGTLPWPAPPSLRKYRAGWASHSAELQYVFGTTSGPDSDNVTDSNAKQFCPYDAAAGEPELRRAIGGYWGSFARTGVPSGAVAWPTFQEVPWSKTRTLVLQAGPYEGEIVSALDLKAADCAFWAAHKD